MGSQCEEKSLSFVIKSRFRACGMARFMQQFENGKGDYSTQRHEWLDGFNVDMLAAQIQQKRAKTSE